jgi:hypothetical protein
MKSRWALTVLTPSKLDPPGALYHNAWDRAYYDQTAQEETMMAFTAMLSEPSAARSVRMNRPLRLPPKLW